MSRENFPIYESSPEMKLPPKTAGRGGKYPWDQIKMGQSFFVGRDEISFASLKTLAYRQGARLKLRFRVIEHEKGFEVGCLGLGINTPSFSETLDPRVAQRVETITTEAPLGWPGKVTRVRLEDRKQGE